MPNKPMNFSVDVLPGADNTYDLGNSTRKWKSINGKTIGAAIEKAVDSSITAGSTSTNLPTTAAVVDYVEDVALRPFFTTVGFSIDAEDWTLDATSGLYTYTFTSALVGQNTTVDVYYDLFNSGDSLAKQTWAKAQNNAGPDIVHQQVTGGVKFSCRVAPSYTVTGTIRVLGSSSDHRMIVFSDGVIPIEQGGTNAANAAGARANLGLGNVENKSSATIRSEITQANVNAALNTGSGTAKFYREDGTWAVPPQQDLSSLAPKASPVFTGSISLGRKAGTTAGTNSFAVGDDVEASGDHSHAEGSGTIATHNYHHVFGRNNVEDPADASDSVGTYVEIVGNGASTSSRSNARTLDWSGNERLKGTLYVNANANGTGGTEVLTRGSTWGDIKGT